MTDTKPGTHDERPDEKPDDEPTTGAKSYGGMTGKPGQSSGVTGQTGGLTDTKADEEQDDRESGLNRELEQKFPGEEQGSIGNRGADPAEGEVRRTEPDTKAQSPNAGQPLGKDQGNKHSTGY